MKEKTNGKNNKKYVLMAGYKPIYMSDDKYKLQEIMKMYSPNIQKKLKIMLYDRFEGKVYQC